MASALTDMRALRHGSGPLRCVSRLTWGLGPKPFFNGFRVEHTRTATRFLRGFLSRATRALPPLPPMLRDVSTTMTIRRTGGGRSLANFAPLESRFRIDAHCCDFSSPLLEQLQLLATAKVCRMPPGSRRAADG